MDAQGDLLRAHAASWSTPDAMLDQGGRRDRAAWSARRSAATGWRAGALPAPGPWPCSAAGAAARVRSSRRAGRASRTCAGGSHVAAAPCAGQSRRRPGRRPAGARPYAMRAAPAGAGRYAAALRIAIGRRGGRDRPRRRSAPCASRTADAMVRPGRHRGQPARSRPALLSGITVRPPGLLRGAGGGRWLEARGGNSRRLRGLCG